MKMVLKHLQETRVGDDSTMRIGSTIIFHKNEEAWRGIVSEMGTLRNGKTFYSQWGLIPRRSAAGRFIISKTPFPTTEKYNLSILG
jgi:hypothetical protein